MKRVFTNPWWSILLFLAIFWTTIIWLSVKPITKLIVKIFAEEYGMEINKIKPESSKKIYLNNYQYSSLGYSMDTTDEEKTMTTTGIICVLPNGNILHVIMTGENIDGRMKNTEEIIGFITKHQDEIFNDLARTIVEAEQKTPPPELKKEKIPQNDGAIKKKV